MSWDARAARMVRPSQSLFECAISRIYAVSAVSALSLEQALACKTGRPLLARSLWAGLRQPWQRSFFGQAIGIPHSNRLLENWLNRKLRRGYQPHPARA